MAIDNYSSFTYNGVRLDTYGFIRNEGDDLRIFNPSNFSHDFTTPQFGNQSYFVGTTRENREFNFSVVLDSVTLTEYKSFLAWLSPEDEGVLSFDYNENYGYDVKVSSISEATITPIYSSGEKEYHIELDIGFITKNDWAARWIETNPIVYISDPSGTAINELVDSDSGDFVSELSGLWTLVNNHNVDNYYKIYYEFNTPVSGGPWYLLIQKNAAEFYNIKIEDLNTTVSGTIYTEYGIIINGQGEFVPNELDNSILKTGPDEIIGLEFTTTSLIDVIITIEPISREII